jgi:hypothetical protein
MTASAVAVGGVVAVAKVRMRGVRCFDDDVDGGGVREETETERTEEKMGGRHLRTWLCLVLETVVGKVVKGRRRGRLGTGGRGIIATCDVWEGARNLRVPEKKKCTKYRSGMETLFSMTHVDMQGGKLRWVIGSQGPKRKSPKP